MFSASALLVISLISGRRGPKGRTGDDGDFGRNGDFGDFGPKGYRGEPFISSDPELAESLRGEAGLKYFC